MANIATWPEPKPGQSFVDYVTSPEWRRRMAVALIAGKNALVGECRYTVRSEGKTLVSRVFFNNPEIVAKKYVEQYVDKNKSVPVPALFMRAVRAMLKKREPGRFSRRNEWALQTAWDLACFFAVEHLIKKGSKPTPAGEQVGKLMGLSRQAVIDAWKRIRPKKVR